ncbi:hypothetical protein VTN02DRAFT_5886 [Thermoascus thermophilus]
MPSAWRGQGHGFWLFLFFLLFSYLADTNSAHLNLLLQVISTVQADLQRRPRLHVIRFVDDRPSVPSRTSTGRSSSSGPSLYRFAVRGFACRVRSPRRMFLWSMASRSSSSAYVVSTASGDATSGSLPNCSFELEYGGCIGSSYSSSSLCTGSTSATSYFVSPTYELSMGGVPGTGEGSFSLS